jgi:hypothetical protein
VSGTLSAILMVGSLAAFVAVAPVSAGQYAESGPASHFVENDTELDRAPWPCRLTASSDLQSSVRRAWDLSMTFRDQCRTLAAAGAIVELCSASKWEPWRAAASIGRTADGATVARVRVRRGENAVEQIAHELEHVLEYVEGFEYRLEFRSGNPAVWVLGKAFETRRAFDAGRRVAREVEAATRAGTQAGRDGTSRARGSVTDRSASGGGTRPRH